MRVSADQPDPSRRAAGAPLRVVFVGWGAIARTACRLLADPGGGGPLEVPVQVVGVAVRDGSAPRPGLPAGARLLTEPRELEAVAPDVVAEAAGRDSVAQWGRAALGAGADLVVSSVSALADPDLLAELHDLAARGGARLEVQPGALGGIDALSAARFLGLDAVEHRIVKPPAAWRGTLAEDLCDLVCLDAPQDFFRGSAAEAATSFPANANVAMTTALAGIGPDTTQVVLVADPSATTNRHEVTAVGAFGRLEVSTANDPLPDNPKSSLMAALNLARCIRARSASFLV